MCDSWSSIQAGSKATAVNRVPTQLAAVAQPQAAVGRRGHPVARLVHQHPAAVALQAHNQWSGTMVGGKRVVRPLL